MKFLNSVSHLSELKFTVYVNDEQRGAAVVSVEVVSAVRLHVDD